MIEEGPCVVEQRVNLMNSTSRKRMESEEVKSVVEARVI
jgi:hypothetical protein